MVIHAVVNASFGVSPSPVTVTEADVAYGDVCILLESVPSGGVECAFNILLDPMGIDASEWNAFTSYVYVCIISSVRAPSIYCCVNQSHRKSVNSVLLVHKLNSPFAQLFHGFLTDTY